MGKALFVVSVLGEVGTCSGLLLIMSTHSFHRPRCRAKQNDSNGNCFHILHCSEEVADGVRPKKYDAGGVVFAEGSTEKMLCIVAKGEVHADRKSQEVRARSAGLQGAFQAGSVALEGVFLVWSATYGSGVFAQEERKGRS